MIFQPLKYILLPMIFTSLLGCNEESIEVLESGGETKTFKFKEGEQATNIVTATESKIHLINGKYFFGDLDVNRPVDNTNIIIESVANMVINLVLNIRGGHDVKLEPIKVDVAELDLDLVKVAKIQKIRIDIEVDKMKKKSKSNFNFLKSFELKILRIEDGKEYVTTVIRESFSKNKKLCNSKCIILNVADLNLIDYIDDTGQLTFIPTLIIKKTPKDTFKVKGEIDFLVGIKLFDE